jgi:hypothetical protein
VKLSKQKILEQVVTRLVENKLKQELKEKKDKTKEGSCKSCEGECPVIMGVC